MNAHASAAISTTARPAYLGLKYAIECVALRIAREHGAAEVDADGGRFCQTAKVGPPCAS